MQASGCRTQRKTCSGGFSHSLALHWTGIPLRFIPASERRRSAYQRR